MSDYIATRILLLLLFNLTIVALITLVFFVFKNLVKIYFERRQKVPGYKFRTKIVALFMVIVLIPSIFLFIVSSGLINRYIDKWLNPQLKVPIENALSIARTLYDREKQRTLSEARRILKGIPASEGYTVERLRTLPEDATETIRLAFEGKEGTEVISTPEGDIIRAAVPVIRNKQIVEVLVVQERLAPNIVSQAEQIRSDYENYISLYKWKMPLKANYLLALGFFTLIVIFMALWVSLRISRWITDPIQKLAYATDLVAKGDLNVSVDMTRDDEIGILVTSFNRMVKELRESKESLQQAYVESDRRRVCFENIVENIDSGVISTDENQEIITINTTAAKILQINPEDVIGKDYRILLENIESEELKEFIQEINLREFTSTSKQIKATIKGRSLVLRVSLTQLKDSTGLPLGLLVVFEDITEMLKAQQALAWQEVARRMAHEIKNPLTPIKLSTERILKKWRDGSKDFGKVLESATKTIIREVESLQGLVNEFSKLGRMPKPRMEPQHIPSLIEEAASLYNNLNNRISFHHIDNIPKVEIDRQQFKRVMVNLLDNAITATRDGGEIHISATYEEIGKKIIIEVADTGVGIKEEDKEKLFLPYFSTKREGTGLGLAIVHKIIKDHGGEITVRDNEPKGTVFTIVLPVKQESTSDSTGL